jgi:hypothetical protein
MADLARRRGTICSASALCACLLHFPTAIEGCKIFDGSLQAARVVSKMSKSQIAAVAEESTHFARGMAMVDEKAPRRFLPADRASTALTRRHRLDFLPGKPVATCTTPGLACGIRAAGTIVGKHLSSMLRVACISLPGRFEYCRAMGCSVGAAAGKPLLAVPGVACISLPSTVFLGGHLSSRCWTSRRAAPRAQRSGVRTGTPSRRFTGSAKRRAGRARGCWRTTAGAVRVSSYGVATPAARAAGASERTGADTAIGYPERRGR